MIQLSIIIPAYNVAKYIPKCLDSLFNQGDIIEHCEIIVVNDGSTDNTLEIVENYALEKKGISVHTQSNAGVGAARNKGMDMAQGEFICFLDPDDYLAKDVLPIIIDKAKKMSIDLLAFNTKRTETYMDTESVDNLDEIVHSSVLSGIQYMGQFNYRNEIWWYILRKDFIVTTGIRFVEGRWMEDAIFTASILLKANKIVHLELDAHRYVKVPNSAMNNKEDSHNIKIIYANAEAAVAYHGLINSINHSKENERCIERMKERQESFVFFLILRSMKSSLSFKQLSDILTRMKFLGIHPFTNFARIDYSNVIYKWLVPFFNNKILLLILFKTYKTLKKLAVNEQHINYFRR
ncbi:MAG: glycosyltransferase [Bacteroidota bacterium]